MANVDEECLGTAFAESTRYSESIPGVSVITPVYNEAGAINKLIEAVRDVMDHENRSYEVIAIDDGSSDDSLRLLKEAADSWPELLVVEFRRNYGQTAALMAGIDEARGDIIVALDADLQNDPTDITRLLALIDDGYDVVSGWRKNRQDKSSRMFVSRLANRLISWLSGVSLHDYGCTLKAYRRNVLDGMRLYGEMHRFVPIYASWEGARVTELEVKHHPRTSGTSKYGMGRIFKVLLDLMVIQFLSKYLAKPMYVFGGIGFASIGVALVSLTAMLCLRIFSGVSFIETPLPLITSMTLLVGILCILMGLLAEITVRTYFESQSRTAYRIKRAYGKRTSED
jgi:glycosyltransferase involved in cell wall biosynthesis